MVIAGQSAVEISVQRTEIRFEARLYCFEVFLWPAACCYRIPHSLATATGRVKSAVPGFLHAVRGRVSIPPMHHGSVLTAALQRDYGIHLSRIAAAPEKCRWRPVVVASTCCSANRANDPDLD